MTVDRWNLSHVIAASVRQENAMRKPVGKHGREHKRFCDTATAFLMLRQVEMGVGSLLEEVQSVAPNTDDFDYNLPWRRRQENQSNGACSSGASPARESASASTMASAGSTSEHPADDLEYGHFPDNEADEIAYLEDSELEVACTANLNFD
jgi:hypothetical protein